MKTFLPNSITTKDAASALLNGDIWEYVYQWQWRFNNRDGLWETVPQILAEIAHLNWCKRRTQRRQKCDVTNGDAVCGCLFLVFSIFPLQSIYFNRFSKD